MTEPIQTDLVLSNHRRGDFRIAVLTAIGVWLVAFGIDNLLLFRHHQRSILHFIVLSQSFAFIFPAFLHGELIDRSAKNQAGTALFMALVTWVFTLLLEPVRSLLGFLSCITMMAIVSYVTLPVYRRGQEVSKKLRAEALERKKQRNRQSN